MAVCSIDDFERATDEHLSIRLHRDRRDPKRITYSCAGIKAEVQAPIGIKASHAAAVRAVDDGEFTADDKLAIRLQSNRVNLTVRPCSRVETAIETPIRVEPGNTGSIRATDCCEVPAHEHLAIRLQDQGTNKPVGSAGRSETAVPTPIAIEPDDKQVTILFVATRFITNNGN